MGLSIYDYSAGGYDWNEGMSRRAVLAFEAGEMPASKWTKEAMLEAISEIADGKTDIFKQLTRNEIFKYFFLRSSWHHTSSAFNRTDFYSVNEQAISEATEESIRAIIEKRQKREKKESVRPLFVTAKITYSYSEKARRGWKTSWKTEIVNYMSTDKLIETSHGRKRLSCVTVEKKIEQKTKFAPKEKLEK